MPRERDSIFRALADETRREILGLLRTGPKTSGAIADHFESTWPTISRHLAILRDAGFVKAERNGQEIRYELDMPVFEDLIQHLMTWTKGPRRTRAAPQRTRESESEV